MLNLILPIGIAATDTKIKEYRERETADRYYLGGKIRISTYHNKGAFLNVGEKMPALVKGLSVVLTIIIALLFLVSLTFKGQRTLKIGLGLLLGGAFSNSYDRIFKGYVVDYLQFPKCPGFIRNIIFNISDFAIIIGALITALKS